MSYNTDAMIVSNNINTDTHYIVWKRYKIAQVRCWVTILEPIPGATEDDGKQLGFKLYDDSTGTLEIVNFNAKLDMRFFDPGCSTKRNNPSTAGVHGEGGKDAAIIFLRDECLVKMWSDGHKFTFGMYKSKQLDETSST